MNLDDYDWVAADAFGQPSKRRKYVTKKTTEHNDAAAVLSLAPLIEVIGSSLGREGEGNEGGTTCSSEDVEREWEGDEEISSTSTEAVTEPDDTLHGVGSGSGMSSGMGPGSASRWQRRDRERVGGVGGAGGELDVRTAASSSSSTNQEVERKEIVQGKGEGDAVDIERAERVERVGVKGEKGERDESGEREDKVGKDEDGMLFFRAEALLTMRTPSLTPIHT